MISTYLGGVITPNFGEGTGLEMGNISGKFFLGGLRPELLLLKSIAQVSKKADFKNPDKKRLLKKL